MMIRQILSLLLAGLGVIILLISAWGMVRMRGVHQRMQAASIGSSTGIALILISAGVYFRETDQMVRMVLLVVLFFITAPIATTAIARAAWRRPLDRTQEEFSRDDMADPAYRQDTLPSTRTPVAGPRRTKSGPRQVPSG